MVVVLDFWLDRVQRLQSDCYILVTENRQLGVERFSNGLNRGRSLVRTRNRAEESESERSE